MSQVSLMSLRFSESGRWQVCASVNQFADNSLLQRISSPTCLGFTESVRWWGWGVAHQFVNEFLLQQIRSLMILCFNESVSWLVYPSANQFVANFVLHRFSSLTRLRCSESGCLRVCESVRWQGCVVQGISSLTSLCFSESVPWWICASVNSFADEFALQWISSLMTLCSSKSVRWRYRTLMRARRPFPERGIDFGVFILCKRGSPPSIMVTRKPNWSSEILSQGTCSVKGRF